MPFQSQVNLTQAPGVEGDFASANPRHSALSVEGGFVAGAGGVVVGRFAWMDASGKVLTSSGSGVPTGFVHREMQALISTYLTEAGLVIPAGFAVGGLFNAGDFFAKNAGAGAVTIGMKAFANNTDGSIKFAAAGATVAGCTETRFYACSAAAVGELVKISTVQPTA